MIAAALGFLLAAAGSFQEGKSGKDEASVVARIDGRPIEAGRFASFILTELERSGSGTDALEQLVQERLVALESRRRGLVVSRGEVDARIAQLERELRERTQGRSSLEEQLAAMKVDRDQFRALLEKSIACERMMAADFGLPPGSAIAPEKQSLWFQELKAREVVRTQELPAGIAAAIGDERVSRTEWGLKIFESLPPKEADRLFDDFVGIELLLQQGRAQEIEVTPVLIAREIEERSRLLREKFQAQGLVSEGVDYLSTLRARGDDPDAVVAGERFKAEILLKELTRATYGQDGFRAFYDAHRAEFDQAFGRRARVATIFLAAAQSKSAKTPRTWKEASDELAEMRKRVESGEAPVADAFPSLAKLRSEHESAARGGDLGFLSRDELEKRELPVSLLDVPAGSIEGPVITADGVHLFFVSARKEASSFEEIVPEVEKAARRELMKNLRNGRQVERILGAR